MATPKRLFLDSNQVPNIGFFWDAGYKKNIPYGNIIHERKIICICYKWAGEKRVHSLTWDTKQNDKAMLQSFIKITNEADEIIGHNGDRFDLPWIRTRCLFHGISVMPKFVTLDTLKQARSKFRFNSNRLDYIAKYLGLGSKLHTEFDLWRKIVLNKDKKALDYMVKYCKEDVVLLEKVYDKMANHIEPKVHHGVVKEKHRYTCPECGGDHYTLVKYRITAQGYRREQRQCQECGKYHTTAK
jgi:DNA polymerase III epsilon subunit-like protein